MKLALVKSEDMSDWYTIEKAEHDGRTWMEPVKIGDFECMSFQMSARISDACVEGTAQEMREIGFAIEQRAEESFKRCAVDATTDQVKFWSPRNSMRPGIVSRADADDLAEQIRRELGPLVSSDTSNEPKEAP